MLNYISYHLIFGKPVMMYLGILVFSSFLTTAIIGYLIHHGKNIDIQWHLRMVIVSFCLAAIHGTLGILAYF
ncbi:MAG: hypothetical protein WCV90_06110 [Candidatus Woesearchaeota archaeon]|jgi:hypothetical protein